MLAALAHRGVDSSGTWDEGSVGLGHRLLRTNSEAPTVNLPLASERAGLAITADARLDNREELLSLLDFGARPLEEISDGELILAAYERWGERCPQRLLGDFAFALWDRARSRLFCARDHFGVRQLYYHASARLFACSTEIKALLTLPEVPRRLNEARAADYLLSLFEDKSATLYEEVFALPPGHLLVVGREGPPRIACYWSLDAGRELRFGSDSEYAEGYLEIFTEAVRCRLRAEGPTGSALSGGLDSSSVTCVARDLLAGRGRGPLHTFSAVYDEVTECDERHFIEAVLAQGGVVAHYGHPDRFGPLTDWEGRAMEGGVAAATAATARADEPLWNPQMALHWVLYEATQRAGVRVFLDGFGGDFVVSYGVTLITELARSGHLPAAFREARAFARRAEVPLGPLLRNRIALPLAPPPLRRAWRKFRRAGVGAPVGALPLRAEFARRTGAEDRLRTLGAERDRADLTVRERHLADLSSGLYPFALGVDDRATALFGIERRQPFLDRRLVEFCLALPAQQRMRDGWTRFVARRALAKVLPVEVAGRMSKADHSPNFNRGLLTADRDILEDVVLKMPRRLSEYVDSDALREIHGRYLARADNEDGFLLWRVAELGLWLRRAGFDE